MELAMKIQPVTLNNQNNVSLNGYRNLSNEILKSNRQELINIAEFFHNATDNEIKQITKNSDKAYNLIKEAIDGVVTRKKCYVADGSIFCKQRAIDLDNKAASRSKFFAQA